MHGVDTKLQLSNASQYREGQIGRIVGASEMAIERHGLQLRCASQRAISTQLQQALRAAPMPQLV